MGRASLARAALAVAALATVEGNAFAEGAQPVMVEYVAPAPPKCASVDAFQKAVAADVAEREIGRVDWRFRVRIERAKGGEYFGKVTSASGVRTARSCDCADVTAALARAIAEDDLEPVAPAPPTRVEEVSVGSAHPEPTVWRLGARVATWSHGTWVGDLTTSDPGSAAPSNGGFGIVSAELPWGFKRTMFEVGLGAMSSTATARPPQFDTSITAHLTYYVLDTQSCLVDLPLGAGFSALGCLRLAFGSFQWSETNFPSNGGGALWFGAGARLRWQSQESLFLEVQLDAVYGTVSSGEDTKPGWGDAAATVGFRL